MFRVMERAKGSDDPWVQSNCGRLGKPRTYETLGAARGQKSRAEYQNSLYQSELKEFKVQRAVIVEWEDIDG